MSKPDALIPYEATAKIIARGDERILECILSIFPDATPLQLEKVVHFAAGLIHDGMEFGSGISDWHPISPVDAYKQGAHEQTERFIDRGLSNLDAYRMGFEHGISEKGEI